MTNKEMQIILILVIYIIIGIGIIGIIAFIIGKLETIGKKQCKFCKEYINKNATICKHCYKEQ